MKIQAISNINNSRNNTFKARFANDTNGYLKKLWENALKTDERFMKAADTFANNFQEHELKIVKKTVNSNGRDSFTINNRTNGVCSEYSDIDSLTDLLEKLIEDKQNIFKK